MAVVDKQQVEPTVFERLFDRLSYRGHDGEGATHVGTASIGCHQFNTGSRPHASQPVSEGGIYVAFDGRIDNREQLLARLGQEPSKPRPDSRLVLDAYTKWGTEFPEQIRGPFATVLWDSNRRRSVAARDRTGIRHIYYAATDDLFVAGSEARAIAAHSSVADEPNRHLIREFLDSRLETAGESFYRDIARLEPGTVVTWDPDGLSVDRYWRPPYGCAPDANISDHGRQLEQLLRSAIGNRLEVVGNAAVMMSGGLDSTLIGSLVTEESARRETGRAEAFVVTFDGISAIDERTSASAVSTDGVSTTFLDGADIWPLKRDFRALVGTPCRDSSLELFDTVTAKARADGFEGVFTGVGGNLFDGNRLAYTDLLCEGHVADFVREAWRDDLSVLKAGLLYGLLPAATSQSVTLRELNYRDPPIGVDRDDERPPAARREPKTVSRALSFVNCSLRYQLTDPYMDFVSDSIRRIALANGTELFHPFLDSRIIAFLFRLGPGSRFHNGRHKRLVRQAARGIVPESVREQPVHANAYSSFLRRGIQEEASTLQAALSNGTLVEESYLEKDQLERLHAELPVPDGVESQERLWRAATTARWLDEF
ncbi:asparagine synthetase B family protein [Haloarcula salinisoli]|uniref:Putative asparagine synthetase [glutamine-hydrolyzing] n=1 Tax=Haloarcula salinisoli TaxID=2487746 RepID=A0A8J7YNJ0_9EURY|nr:asparagine synthase-related protein [Halomicroarcula salinisoli]MBX0288601.1 hypothetical protein [Halomicroarcula salinisoli]MBX0306019.1 hypothetical protein [Halomicroarcula salinisoli]